MTTNNKHLGVGKRFRFLLILFITFMIILPSFFSAGQTIEEETGNSTSESIDAAYENDWFYYFQLPISLILILILMVAMMIYVRRMK